MQNSETKKCVLFIRSGQSDPEMANNDFSCQYQILHYYATSHGLEIVGREHVRGSANSPSTERAIETLLHRKKALNDYDTILAVSLDRFTRNVRKGLAFKDAATRSSIRILTLQDSDGAAASDNQKMGDFVKKLMHEAVRWKERINNEQKKAM